MHLSPDMWWVALAVAAGVFVAVGVLSGVLDARAGAATRECRRGLEELVLCAVAAAGLLLAGYLPAGWNVAVATGSAVGIVAWGAAAAVGAARHRSEVRRGSGHRA